jgi:hypothetical protein
MQGLIAKGAVATKEAPLQSLSITNFSILPTFMSISFLYHLVYLCTLLSTKVSLCCPLLQTYMNEEFASDLSVHGPAVSSQNDLSPAKLYELGIKHK